MKLLLLGVLGGLGLLTAQSAMECIQLAIVQEKEESSFFCFDFLFILIFG